MDPACLTNFSPAVDELIIDDAISEINLTTANCSLAVSSITCAASGSTLCPVTVVGSGSIVFPAASSSLLVQRLLVKRSGNTGDVPLIRTSRDLVIDGARFSVSNKFLSVEAGASVAIKSTFHESLIANIHFVGTFIDLAASTSLLLDTAEFVDCSGTVLISAGSGTNVTTVGTTFSNLLGSPSGSILQAHRPAVVSIRESIFTEMNVGLDNASPTPIISVVDSFTPNGVPTDSLTTEMIITGSSFTHNDLKSSDPSSALISITGVASYQITDNVFTNNTAKGCTLMLLTSSSGVISGNTFTNTALTQDIFITSTASVCIHQDYSSVDPASTASHTIVGNNWSNATFTRATLDSLTLNLMNSPNYPFIASALSAHNATITLTGNTWSSAAPTEQTRVPSVLVDRSVVTINADSPGSEAHIDGFVDIASYVTLQANLTSNLLGIYGANSFRLSNYSLNGYALIARKQNSVTNPANSVITGGRFENGVIVLEAPLMICCGSRDQAAFPISADSDSLEFFNVAVHINGEVALARTTTPLILSGTSPALQINTNGGLYAVRPVSPYLSTGLNPATIQGSVFVAGTLQAVDLLITGDLVNTPTSSILVIPTRFRGAQHGITILGEVNLEVQTSGNKIGVVNNMASQFGVVSNFVGEKFPPYLEIDSTAVVFNTSSSVDNLFENEQTTNELVFTPDLASKKKKNAAEYTSVVRVYAIIASQRYDVTGRAIYIDLGVPVNPASHPPQHLLSSSDAGILYDEYTLLGLWVSNSTLMYTSSFLSESACLNFDTPNFRNPDNCTIDSSALREPVPYIKPVPVDYVDQSNLTLDATGSYYLGPIAQNAVFHWSLSYTSAADSSAIVAALNTVNTSIVSLPASLFQDGATYNFSLHISNAFFPQSNSTIVQVVRNPSCTTNDYPVITFDREVTEVYDSEFSSIAAHVSYPCGFGESNFQPIRLSWTLSALAQGSNESHPVPLTSADSISPVLTYKFVSLIDYTDSGYATSYIPFNTPTTLTASAEVTLGEGEPITVSASTTIILRYPPPKVVVDTPSAVRLGNTVYFSISNDARLRTPSFGSSIPHGLPILSLSCFVSSCPVQIEPETSMLFGDSKPPRGPTVDYCRSANLSSWYPISFSHSSEGCSATGMELGSYVFAAEYTITTNDDSLSVRGVVSWSIEVTNYTPFSTQIKPLQTAIDAGTVWNSPSKRIVLQTGCGSALCAYNWYFPNGELQLTPAEAANPFLVIEPGKLAPGTNTTISVDTYDFQPEIPERKKQFGSSSSSVTYRIEVGQSPLPGLFTVSPTGSSELDVKFELLAQGFESAFPTTTYYYTIVDRYSGMEWVTGLPTLSGSFISTIPYWCPRAEARRNAMRSCDWAVRLRAIDATSAVTLQDVSIELDYSPSSISDVLSRINQLESDVYVATSRADVTALIPALNQLAYAIYALENTLWPAPTPAVEPVSRAIIDDFAYPTATIMDGIYLLVNSSKVLPDKTTDASVSPAFAHAVLTTITNCAQAGMISADTDFASELNSAALEILANMTSIPVSGTSGDFGEPILNSLLRLAEVMTAVGSRPSVTADDLISEISSSILFSLYGSTIERYASDRLSYAASQFVYRSDVSSSFAISASPEVSLAIATDQADIAAIEQIPGVVKIALTYTNQSSFLPADAKFRGALTIDLPSYNDPARREVEARPKANYTSIRRFPRPSALRRAFNTVQNLIYGYDVQAEEIEAQIAERRAANENARRATLAGSKKITFSTNITMPSTITAPGDAKCSLKGTGATNWDSSSCRTTTRNNVVTCTCSASQTKTSLSVLFGTFANKRGGISKGGIAAAVIFPLIILAVAGVVLVNLFVPKYACGPFKRYHGRNQLNAVQMDHVGPKAGPPRSAPAPASSSSLAPLVSPTPAPAAVYAAPVAIAPEHAPTPDPLPSSGGWTKSAAPSDV